MSLFREKDWGNCRVWDAHSVFKLGLSHWEPNWFFFGALQVRRKHRRQDFNGFMSRIHARICLHFLATLEK
jgi:hypothetical protein